MPFSFEEKGFIKILRQKRDVTLNEFVPNFGKRNGLLVRLTIFYGKSTKLVQLNEKSAVDSQEDNPGTSKSPREIQKVTDISRSSVRRIAKRDLRLNVFRRKKAQLLSDADRQKRIKCCKTLLRRRCLLSVDKVWFSDEKLFTVQPSNTQNDRVRCSK